jgi:hypothetical protein
MLLLLLPLLLFPLLPMHVIFSLLLLLEILQSLLWQKNLLSQSLPQQHPPSDYHQNYYTTDLEPGRAGENMKE